MRTLGLLFTAVALLAIGARPVSAGDAVLESYAGERPADAADLLKPLFDELDARGYVVGTSLRHEIEQRHSRTGGDIAATDLARVKGYLDGADDAFIRGEWEEALEDAEQGLEILLSSPAALAGDEKLRGDYRHGLIIVAESHRRLGNAKEATRAMAAMLRAFPTTDISSSRYSPAVTRFYNETRRDLDKLGKGVLEVRVDDPAVVVFVNERYIGAGRVSLKVIPGTYRIMTRKGTVDGRVHLAQVEPGRDVTLSLSWPLDAALSTSDDYVGLEHESEVARAENEARNAILVARKTGATGVVVVGIRAHDGRRSIVGQVLSLDSGKALRTGTLAIEPVEPRAETVRNLGRYLAGEDVEGFEAVLAPELEVAGDESSSWLHDPLGWSLSGVGVAGAAIGFGLMANASSLESDSNDEPIQARRRALREDADRRRLGGAIAVAAGGALLIGGVITLARNPQPEEEEASTWLLVGPRGIAFGGSF